MKKTFTKFLAALALLVFMTPMAGWGQTSLATWEFTSTNYPSNKTNFNATGGPCTSSTFYLNGSGSTWNSTKGYAFTAVTDIDLTLVLDRAVLAGETITFSAETYYNKASNAPMTGFNLTIKEGSGSYSTTGLSVSSWALSNSAANKTVDYTVQGNLPIGGTIALKLTGTGKAGSGQGYMNDIAIVYTGGTPSPSMSVSTNSIDFGSDNTINPSEPYTETFDVTFANLTENLIVTGFSGISVSPATINYNATSPQTVTVSYNPTEVGSISGNISVNSSEVTEALVAVTGSAYDPANVDTYEIYTGTIVEGDYVIYNTSGAMKNEISSNRFANQNVNIEGTTITNPNASAIWHIAPIANTNYWSIYNVSVGKYAGGTNYKNQGALYDDTTNDLAKWTITYNNGYVFHNYGRSQASSDSGNAYLRQNSTSGWGTYTSSYGSAPQLYKKVIANQVAMPTFSVAAGTYYEAQSVTLSCATDDATIYYTTDGTTPSASSTAYSTAISVSETMTIKAIAIKSGMTDSDIATASYTISLPLSTMDQIFAAATSASSTATDARIALNNWVVSGANSSSHAFVTDGTKGFMIYGSNHGFTAGDVLSGTVECKVQLYNGAAEITQLTSSTSGLTVTTGGSATVANIAMADLAGINTGDLVSYQNLTCEARTENSYTNYYLSDGTTEIQAYKTLLDNYADYLEDGKTYNITGVFVMNNSTKRINPRSAADIEEVVVPIITVDPDSIEVDADGGNGTLDLTYENMTIGNMNDFAIQYYNADGEEITDPNWLEVVVAEQDPNIGEGYVVSYDIYENEGEARTAYFKVFAEAGDDFVFSNLVTVEQAAPLTGDEYELYSGALVEGDYLIVYGGKAMNNTTTSNRLQYEEVVAINNVITTDNAEIVWHIAPSATDGYWTIYSADAQAYAAGTGTKNQATTMTGGTDDKALWSVTVAVSKDNTYEFVNKNNYEADPQVNYLLRNNGTYGFACYGTGTGGALSLYKKVGTDRTFELSINGYGENTAVTNGWYLVASPVAEDINPAWYNGFITSGYDLYRFNPTATKQWENHKVHNFDIEHGRGYLYASQSNTKLLFTGTPHTDSEVTLAYTGWNLIGNPSNIESSITPSFYVMNDDHDEIVVAAGDRTVHGLEGIFVYGNQGDEIAFEEQPAKRANSQVTLNIVGNNSNVIDRAIVRFNSDRQLGKLTLFDGDTKIYIPQNDGDYAIVSSDGQGTMPVNFKAKEMGMYTISVETEGIDLSYLHLIDRLTGDDVNLLLDSKYSFIASNSDTESRFILSFNENGINANNDTFAFQNGSDIIVNGEGELQIFDVMGRNIMNTMINGVQTVNVKSNGVYIFKLNEKTQKIIVR